MESCNQYAHNLLAKIENKDLKIGVIGLGYVGLPLAVEKVKAGYHVTGFDIQLQRVEMINRGINYIGDVVDEELARIVREGRLTATTDYSRIREMDVITICVPTPLDMHHQPDTSYVENSAREIAKHFRKGTLVVLESTTYPGTTEELVKPILEENGYRCGEDFFLAYSPERVDPGNKIYKTKNTPKVIGGVTKTCTAIAATLYRNVLEGDVHEVSSPAVAEMEKILENTFRIVNIALANEMAILCNRMGIDVWEVIDAAATKPYGFMPFYPGPGVGGHCIPIDPFYLTWKAREFDYHTRLIELAGEINNSMPDFVVNRCMQILNREKKALNGSRILVMGVAYKKDIDDYRESPVIKILEQLEEHEAEWTAVDPYVKQFKFKGRLISTYPSCSESDVRNADLVLITTDHSAFDYEMLQKHAKIIFDTRNSIRSYKGPGKYYKL